MGEIAALNAGTINGVILLEGGEEKFVSYAAISRKRYLKRLIWKSISVGRVRKICKWILSIFSQQNIGEEDKVRYKTLSRSHLGKANKKGQRTALSFFNCIIIFVIPAKAGIQG